MKNTNRSAKNIATRAANSYGTGKHNSAHAFFNEDGSLHLLTCARAGDNVPWAKSLFEHVAASFRRHGYKPDYSTQLHNCGTVTATLRPIT
jgi:hypothetical protein